MANRNSEESAPRRVPGITWLLKGIAWLLKGVTALFAQLRELRQRRQEQAREREQAREKKQKEVSEQELEESLEQMIQMLYPTAKPKRKLESAPTPTPTKDEIQQTTKGLIEQLKRMMPSNKDTKGKDPANSKTEEKKKSINSPSRRSSKS
ncbi:hypothetical protein [Abyssalbus ytuae]|uniref:Uncharacterized protein n=1 Tax=Abyssalbus ytuae TaxID=2926907 RepID=A0A9E7CZC4_9FLAO|nr:hypothetical protein [Abyssalbus ytuae]UOB17425.1 hypothetical protein MQE35_17020 [Abyssalbus ytuae]